MDKKLIRRIATVVMACASVSVFAFVGCNKPDGHTHTPGEWQSNETKHWHVCADCDAKVDEGNHTYDNDQDTDCNTCGYVRTVPPGGGTENPGGGTENPGGGTENPGGGTETPAITATTPVLSKQSADELETAYVEWTVQNTEGVWFNVYYMADNGSTWTKLDDELVRQYADFYRADMVGLKAGTYKMKIVPTVDNEEVSGIETIANNITVKAHDRSGYGFADSKAPGAYNLDGTLKANAKVIYVTAQTAKTVTCTVIDGKNTINSTGFQTILDDRQGSGDTTPLCFRIIGTVNLNDLDHISSSS